MFISLKMYEKATFSVELTSLDNLSNISLSNNAPGRVFFEGSLGEVKEVKYVNNSVLEVEGSEGVLCIGVKKRLLLGKLGKEKTGNE